MMKLKLFTILFFFSSILCQAQQIDELQSQIEQSEAEISRISGLIASNRDQQIQSSSKIKLLEKRLKLRQNLVRQTSSKILSLDKKLRSYDSKVLHCESIIDSVKLSFEQLVLEYNQNFIFDFDSLEYYSQLIHAIISRSFINIDSLDTEISNTGIARSDVVYQKKQMDLLLAKRKSEVEQIIKETRELDSLKCALKIGESKMLSQIESHRSIINKLQREIQRLVSLDKNQTYIDSETLTRSFKQNVGNLPTPLSVNYKLIDEYGTHNHPTYKGVTISNQGVNLSFVGTSNVMSIADGIVSGIYSISGYGSIVLVRHGQFISVYSNITNVKISKGDNVSQGQLLGVINAPDTEERLFHFELWQEHDGLKPLNPQQWIRF